MTFRWFIRATLWLLVVIESLTAAIIACIPLLPEDLPLAGEVVTSCAIAAGAAAALLAIDYLLGRRFRGWR